jgi:parallel beta-helix repeat protein
MILVMALAGCSKPQTEPPDSSVAQKPDEQTSASDAAPSDMAPSDAAPSDMAPSDMAPGDAAPSDAPTDNAAASDAAPADAAPKVVSFKPGADVQTAIQEELILAEPGTVIQLEEGHYELTSGLSLDVDDVTIRGAGIGKTILSFKDQEAGAEGIYVTGDRVLVEDMTIMDTKGNGVKSHTANDIVIRRVHVEWSGGPKSTNGAYGIYSVVSTNNLIDECVSIGASDAGIYVGQSTNIMVRNCRAEYNVAGIEIENCHGGEAYNNVATKNTGGILVFDLPDLPLRRGHDIRVHHNRVFDNNTPNFAPPGNIVATVPTGTGMMVMANDNIEVFDNDVRDHGTVNLLINSYLLAGLAINDPQYNPYPERIHVHDNTFGPCGDKPADAGGKLVAAILGTPLPDIIWDGVLEPSKHDGQEENPGSLISIHGNKKDGGDVTFANLGGQATLADPTKANVKRDLSAYAAALPPVPVASGAVTKEGAGEGAEP